MARILLVLALLAVVFLLARRIGALPPHRRRGEYVKLGLAVALALTLLLALTGKMHWLGAAITGLLVAARQVLPIVVRLFPLFGSSASAPRQSTVATAVLRMRLDHESGDLSGEVIDGPFKGWWLNEMSREQLDELRAHCARHDAESLQLLEAYLEQRFAEEPDPASRDSAPPAGGMNRQEALEVLGLSEGADREAVIEAHRKLIHKLHPDRGGSDYLAAKINQAKDLLLQD